MRLASYIEPLTEIEALMHYSTSPGFCRPHLITLTGRLGTILSVKNPNVRIDVYVTRTAQVCVVGWLFTNQLSYEVAGEIRGRRYRYGTQKFELPLRNSYAEMVDDFTREILKSPW